MVEQHLTQLKAAIAAQDIAQIGTISEHNALSMHATMLSASPALCYFLPETIATLQTLWQARSEGLACWATLDAGPNVKLLFDQRDEADVKACFPEVSIMQPFA
jgi:diphosphomevalonate decarboxylase